MKLINWLKRQRMTLQHFIILHGIQNYQDLIQYCNNKKLVCPPENEVKHVFTSNNGSQTVEKRSNNTRKIISSTDKKRRDSKRRQTNSDSVGGSKTGANKSKGVGRSSRKRKKDIKVEPLHERSESTSNGQ